MRTIHHAIAPSSIIMYRFYWLCRGSSSLCLCIQNYPVKSCTVFTEDSLWPQNTFPPIRCGGIWTVSKSHWSLNLAKITIKVKTAISSRARCTWVVIFEVQGDLGFRQCSKLLLHPYNRPVHLVDNIERFTSFVCGFISKKYFGVQRVWMLYVIPAWHNTSHL